MKLKQLGNRVGLFLRMTLNRASTVFALSLIIFSTVACGKDEIKPDDKTPVTEVQPVQYDVPFKNVPATADISMYEVNLWAFSDSQDLQGVESRLDEIKALGINVIWLMPIYPTGELKGVGSPYAVRDYMKVNPVFGSLDDLRSLVKEAHKRDMAVILDWVANHTAWDHPWIQNATWYTRDGSGNIISPAGMGWNDVADLNFGSQAMRKEMIKAMKYWILEANVDGYRCDYAEGVPNDFWKQALDTLRNIPNRELIMFAEAGKKELFQAGFDLTFGWSFYHKLKDVIHSNASASGLVTVNASDYTSVPQGSHILRWITNHDDNAWDDTPVNIFKGQAGATAAFVVTAYMGGVPLIYNGQEVGFPAKIQFFNNSTTKINWSLNPEILQEYRALMAFRNSSDAVKRGSIETYHTADVVAFKRVAGDEEVLVIVNIRDSEITYQLPNPIANTQWKNSFTENAVSLAESIELAPFAYFVLKK